MNPSLVQVDLAEPAVTIVTMNRPDKRNALSIELMEALRDAIRATRERAGARVLILRGNGPVFCAGLDLQEAQRSDHADQSAKALADVYEAIATSPAVTIAAAQGAAMGGGVGLLAACDLVVAADDLRIGFPEVRRGLVAALITALLCRQIAERTLRELVLLGQTIDAERAREIGLVNRVAPADQVGVVARELASEALAGAPGAIVRSKRLLDELADRPVREGLALALRYHREARDSAEAAEGIAAFLEKRSPTWQHREGSSE